MAHANATRRRIYVVRTMLSGRRGAHYPRMRTTRHQAVMSRRVVVTVVVLAVASVLAGIAPSARAAGVHTARGGRWSEEPSMALGREFAEAAVLPDGRVIVAGGHAVSYPAGGTPPLAEIYDPDTRSWSFTSPMQSFHSKHTVTALADGRVLVTGGEGRISLVRGNELTVSEVYDPGADAWTVTGPMTTEEPFNHTANLLADGRVLVAGGTASTVLADAQLYDPVTNTWSTTNPMHHPRTYHASVRLRDGRILVAGGYDDSGLPMNTAEIWDPNTGQWTDTGPMVAAYHSETNDMVVLRSGQALLVAGVTVVNGQLVQSRDAQIFNPATGTWRPTTPLPGPPRTDHTVTALPDGRVLVAGGLTEDLTLPSTPVSSVALADAYVFDPARETWTIAPPMDVARSEAAAALLQDGTVLVAGGQHGVRDGAFIDESRVERFTPAR